MAFTPFAKITIPRKEFAFGIVVERGLEKYFIFVGQKPIEDIPKFADVASVFVGCLTKSDLLEATIPAKVISYIAMGKPIILAMDGEVQNLINSTIMCGFAGPSGDARALAENIARAYRLSPFERIKMGDRARIYHQNYLSRSVLLGELNNTLKSSARIQ